MPSRRFVAPLSAALLAAGAARAQPAAAQPAAPGGDDAAVIARLRDAGAAGSQVLRTATILSDVFGPRLAGSPNYRAAAEWARRELASYGLAAHLEAWGTRAGRSWAPTHHSVELVAPYYARLVAYPKAWSPPTAGIVRGTPVLVTDVRADTDVARYGDRLRGRIVLLGAPPGPDTSALRPLAHRWDARELDSLARLSDPGSPRDYWEDAGGYAEGVRRRNAVSIALGRAGVAAVLEPSASPYAVLVGSFQAYDSDVSGAPPSFRVARGDYTRVVNLLRLAAAAGQPAPVVALDLATASVAPRTRADSTGYDVIAELPGSDPATSGEVVMVGAHFDSWTAGTGATDNAAGAAVAMEALRLLHVAGARPRRTIRVALWDGEEHEDYFGSLGYVRRHFGDPETMQLRPEHGSISAYFNFDHGTGRVRGVRLQGNAAARPFLERMLAPLADLGATTVTLANAGSTDHMPFAAVGVPAFTFVQDPLHYEALTHHTNADVAANLLPADLQQAALVTAAVLYQTANLPGKLPRLPLPPPHAPNASR
ncbi:peptidase M28 [Gemmatirosa kalamazoonensis]|uniref:Carboxypeptidase Q n=1 Tax=Gemmatirosa kalamazoonensis TaxID=861299 RepID=W0RDQ7_9BACT|nr:M20/M25/M40 family metallo-hydrolase [Gemmatirosa kalamazoonensis]AHG88577.1 peptidase M28 [Gemmatirosa kalamazoonensis]